MDSRSFSVCGIRRWRGGESLTRFQAVTERRIWSKKRDKINLFCYIYFILPHLLFLSQTYCKCIQSKETHLYSTKPIYFYTASNDWCILSACTPLLSTGMNKPQMSSNLWGVHTHTLAHTQHKHLQWYNTQMSTYTHAEVQMYIEECTLQYEWCKTHTGTHIMLSSSDCTF